LISTNALRLEVASKTASDSKILVNVQVRPGSGPFFCSRVRDRLKGAEVYHQTGGRLTGRRFELQVLDSSPLKKRPLEQ
jgi:hypothetical protein